MVVLCLGESIHLIHSIHSFHLFTQCVSCFFCFHASDELYLVREAVDISGGPPATANVGKPNNSPPTSDDAATADAAATAIASTAAIATTAEVGSTTSEEQQQQQHLRRLGIPPATDHPEYHAIVLQVKNEEEEDDASR